MFERVAFGEVMVSGNVPMPSNQLSRTSPTPVLSFPGLPPSSTSAHELQILHRSLSILIAHKPAGLPLSGSKPKTGLSILSSRHNFTAPQKPLCCPPRPVSGPIIFLLSDTQPPSNVTFTLHAVVIGSPNRRIRDAVLLLSSSIPSPAGPLRLLTLSSSQPGTGLRKRLREAGCPVLGDATLSGIPARGLYVAVSRVELPELGVNVDCPLPPKFSTLVAREGRLEERRQAREVQEERNRYDGESGETKTRFLRWYFFTSNAMTPRKSSECVAMAAAELLRETFVKRVKRSDTKGDGEMQVPRLLDLGTGCGCLMAGALLSANVDAEGVGLELNNEAGGDAKRNIQSLGLMHFAKVVQGDFTALEKSFGKEEIGFDVVISNPPYLTRKEIEFDKVGLAREPQMALLGQGGDGMGSYKAIAESLRRCPAILRYGGYVVLEVGGTRSGDSIREMFEQIAGLCFVDLKVDERGFERCLVLRRHGA